jgi:agmatine deiminase
MSDSKDLLTQIREGLSEGNLSRRTFLARAGIAAAAGVAGLAATGTSLGAMTTRLASSTAAFWVPGEASPHKRTWMAWPSNLTIWGSHLLPGVQDNIALIAKTIAKYEPVIMCADGAVAASVAMTKCGPTVQVISSIPVDDCWMADTAPQFRINGLGGMDAVGLNFNGWGNRQTHAKDALVAQRIATYLGLPFTAASFVGEGGAIQADGDGTVMATESSLVNSNRNGSKTKAQIEASVLAAYGASKMIWFPGIYNKDITDDHVDATSIFIRPGVTMDEYPLAAETSIWANDERQQYDLLGTSTDAKGRAFARTKLVNPDVTKIRQRNSKTIVDAYANYHVVNGAVIAANFGDAAADAAAKVVLANAYPGRVIEMLNIDNLALGGGGIHCVTAGEPLL